MVFDEVSYSNVIRLDFEPYEAGTGIGRARHIQDWKVGDLFFSSYYNLGTKFVLFLIEEETEIAFLARAIASTDGLVPSYWTDGSNGQILCPKSCNPSNVFFVT